MPRRQRDYRAEYARRKELATEQGWRSYSQKRTASERFRDEEDIRRRWQHQAVERELDLDPTAEPQDFAAFYRAFYDPKESRRRDANSARAKWFVEVTGQVASYNVWEERYA